MKNVKQHRPDIRITPTPCPNCGSTEIGAIEGWIGAAWGVTPDESDTGAYDYDGGASDDEVLNTNHEGRELIRQALELAQSEGGES